jgi:hypothetical protein
MMLHSLPIGGARCRKDRYDPRMVGRTVRDLPMCSPGARRPRLRRSRAGVRRRPGRCGNRLYPISPNHRHSCLPWRVAVLYLAGEVFACRKCYGLAYASQQGGLLFRNLRKSQGIRMRLGGSPDTRAASHCYAFHSFPHPDDSASRHMQSRCTASVNEALSTASEKLAMICLA